LSKDFGSDFIGLAGCFREDESIVSAARADLIAEQSKVFGNKLASRRWRVLGVIAAGHGGERYGRDGEQ
jgi:hypothetical protein